MGVIRKRVASAKQRRVTFDDIATKAEKDNESSNYDSSEEDLLNNSQKMSFLIILKFV